MDLNALYAELLEALKGIEGLRVNPTDARSVNPPAVIPATPTVIEYDRTYGGLTRLELILTVVASQTTSRSGVTELLALTSPVGPRSIKQTLEAYDGYELVDSVTALRAEDFGALELSGVNYLAANVVVEVYGKAVA